MSSLATSAAYSSAERTLVVLTVNDTIHVYVERRFRRRLAAVDETVKPSTSSTFTISFEAMSSFKDDLSPTDGFAFAVSSNEVETETGEASRPSDGASEGFWEGGVVGKPDGTLDGAGVGSGDGL